MIKAIIFDFDGVLVKSENPRFEAIKNAASNYGVKIPDDTFKKMIGTTTANFLNSILLEKETPLIEKIVEEYRKNYKANIVDLVEPVDLTINFIKNYQGNLMLALASMNTRKSIEEIAQHYGIFDKFQSIISVEEVTHHKPNPEIYTKSADALKLLPSECIAIEDTTFGVQSALNAGMECAVLLNGVNNKDEFLELPIKGFITSQEDLKKISK